MNILKKAFWGAVILMVCWSCGRSKDHAYGHPEHFDPLFRKAYSMVKVHPEKAVAFIDSVFKAYPDPGISDLDRKYYFIAEYYYYYPKDYRAAVIYVDSSLWAIRDHAEDKRFQERYVALFQLKGDALLAMNQYLETFDTYYKIRESAEKSGDIDNIAIANRQLGWLSNKQGKYLDAARYTKQAVAEAKLDSTDFGHFGRWQAAMDDVGIYYSRSNMPDSALYFFNETIAYLKAGRITYGHVPENKKFIEEATGVVYGNMGDAYYQMGDTASAEQLYRKSIQINRQEKYDRQDAQYTRLKLAGLYFAQNKTGQADTVLTELRKTLDSLPDLNTELRWYKLKLNYLDKTGLANDKIYSRAGRYMRLNDSLAKAALTPQVSLNQEYEHIKDQYALTILTKKNELKNLSLIVVAGFSVLVVLIALLLLHNWKRSKSLNNTISEQNLELRKALYSLGQSQDKNTYMMKIVAHDLKNPIASAILVADLLLHKGKQSDEDAQLLRLIKTASEHSMELISDLLNPGTNSSDWKRERVEMDLLLRYCTDLLQLKASGKNQQIVLDAQKVAAFTNKEKIIRVINNLLENAVKFSPEGSVIEVRSYQDEQTAGISIHDSGIGIPDNLKEGIFDMIPDTRRFGTAGEQSFGLGLTISRQIVEALDGTLWFESKAGKGASFFISLPLSS